MLRIASSAELLLQLHAGTYDKAQDAALVDKIGWLVESYDSVLAATTP